MISTVSCPLPATMSAQTIHAIRARRKSEFSQYFVLYREFI